MIQDTSALVVASSVLDAALEIARERRNQMSKLCQAVIDRDYKSAEQLARHLGGLDEKNNRTH
ncbi:MAG: hypothetical protein QOD75_137 [Blastocatellia bacterium]|jgi:predicted unusual protein kinase regulating ubiquinone biosynthesis (AarF/ABC1/UbiB family)|nr:hypothetical protein [Blastocatellia bacterium]